MRGRRGRGYLAPALVGLVLAGLSATPAVAAGRGGMIQVIVNFADRPGAAAVRAIENQGGSVARRFRLINSVSATIPAGALNGLRANPAVKSVERDAQITAFDHAATSSNPELEAAWGVEHIGAGEVHASGNTGAGIKVGVIDTGIDYNHPDLDSVYAGGYDFFNNDPDPMDDQGHGTHVAGILAAERNDPAAGVVGVAPGVDLYAYKVLGATGEGDYSLLIAALERASLVDDVDVVNMSLGGNVASDALAAAVTAAYNRGTVLVAASGNVNPANFSELLFGCPVRYPAAYPEVFATTFTGQNDQLTGFSCTGPQVDFAAPGDLINSTVPTGTCTYCAPSGYRADLSGTSMASPHLAGTVALVLAHGIANSGAAFTLADDVKAHLCSTAHVGFGVNSTRILPTDSRYPNYFGCGVVDANNALITNPPSGDPPPPPPANRPPVAVNDALITAQDNAATVNVLANDTDPDGDPLSVASVTQPANGTAQVVGNAVRYTPAAGFNGSDWFSYTAADGRGGEATATVSVTVNPPPPNRPPVANNDSTTTVENTAVTVNVLANDSDPDADPLSVSAITQPANGTTSIVGTGVRYTPAPGYVGSDSFSYTVSDGRGGATSANVTVTVSPTPNVHVADIDASVSKRTKTWSIQVRVYVHGENHGLRQNVVVTGRWSNGATASCTTNRSGYCQLPLIGILLTVPSHSFTVTNLTLSGRPYDASRNHDPDGDSNGTFIVVARP